MIQERKKKEKERKANMKRDFECSPFAALMGKEDRLHTSQDNNVY